MTTRFTLNISSDNIDPNTGMGVTQNATVASENPDELIAALSQLAGVNRASNNYGAQEVNPNTGSSDCGCGESEEVVEYANEPEPEVYSAGGGVGDLVDTGHSASVKNRYTRAGSGDNPLAETDDEEEDDWYDRDGTPNPHGAFDAAGHFYPEREADRHYEEDAEFDEGLKDTLKKAGLAAALGATAVAGGTMAKGAYDYHHKEVPGMSMSQSDIDHDILDKDYQRKNEDIEESLSSSLMREWTEEKLQSVSQEFDADAAMSAIFEGKAEYTQGTKKFAIRKDTDAVKVFPIMENRTVMTMPLLVLDAASLVAEKDLGKHNNATTGFAALAKKAGGGEKGAKIAGAQLAKMRASGAIKDDVEEAAGDFTVKTKSPADAWKQHTNTGSKEHDVPTDPKTGKTLFQKVTSEETEDLDEKAVSKAQQRFMGMVHAAQQGEKPASKEVAAVAKDMSKKDAEDFAATKHKGLPDHVGEDTVSEDQEAVDAVAGAVTRRIMSQHTDILSKYGPVKVMAAIDDVAQFAGGDGLDEIGSSDVSIWTKQVIQDLESGHYDHVDEDLSEGSVEEGPHAATIGAIAAAAYQPKVGDKIRTRKGGQIPGTVEKVADHNGSEYCWFRHPEGKLYKTPCSNVMREEVEEGMEEAMEPWMGKDTDRPAVDRKREHEQGKPEGGDVSDRFRNPGSDTPAWKRKRPAPKSENIEMNEELAQIMALAGMHEAAKPDFLDLDKDGDKKEPMAKAAKDKEEMKEGTCSACHKDPCECDDDKKMDEAKPDFLDLDKDGDKEEPMSKAAKDKEEKVDEDADFDYMMSLLNKWR